MLDLLRWGTWRRTSTSALQVSASCARTLPRAVAAAVSRLEVSVLCCTTAVQHRSPLILRPALISGHGPYQSTAVLLLHRECCTQTRSDAVL